MGLHPIQVCADSRKHPIGPLANFKASNSTDMAKQTILVVDDEPDILELVQYNLEKEGYVVHTANHGREAIQIARSVTPHLILLDVMMPEMDGMETCIEIRKQPELDESVVAFLTARGEDYSQIAGFEAGADDCTHVSGRRGDHTIAVGVQFNRPSRDARNREIGRAHV